LTPRTIPEYFRSTLPGWIDSGFNAFSSEDQSRLPEPVISVIFIGRCDPLWHLHSMTASHRE
jgi:hypothetical protein